MGSKATLTIIISTLNNGIINLEKTVKLKREGLKYLIVHQNHKNIEVPCFLLRKDITIINTQTKGLSNSRNIGIKNCKTRYALIADDDTEYIEEGINEVIGIISNTKLDLLTFKIKTLDDEPEYKIYPDIAYPLELEKHWVSSIELCVNVASLKINNISFDRRFGLGTVLKKGEETVLVNDLLKKRLTSKYYPIYIVKHPFESSGKEKKNSLFKFFFLGAFNERNQITHSITNYGDKQLRNRISYNFGKLYIRVTNFI